MKILTFTSLFPGHTRPDFAVFIFQRTLHLAKLPGHSVQVVAPVPYFPPWIPSERWGDYAKIPPQETFAGLEVYHPRYPLLPGLLMPLHGLLMFLGCLLLVRRLHRLTRFDCIDAHYVFPDGFAAILLGKMLKIPVIISARGTDVNLFSQFTTIRPIIRWVLLHAAGVIAVSGALKSKIVELGVLREAVRVIPNGIDSKRFHLLERSAARSRLGLAQDVRIAISVASLTKGKNHTALISAFAKVVEGHPKHLLYIIGQGPLREALQKQIGDLGLQSQVYLLGPKPNEELVFWFNSADVSCLVSIREGWPNVVTESIACGTPVVATRVGGIEEIITSPYLGSLVEETPEHIAAGINAAFERDWDRHALVRHAQARDWDQVANEVSRYIASQVQTK
jgi:teichuronic acid biosynthesis glycosyltransferase TuaC